MPESQDTPSDGSSGAPLSPDENQPVDPAQSKPSDAADPRRPERQSRERIGSAGGGRYASEALPPEHRTDEPERVNSPRPADQSEG